MGFLGIYAALYDYEPQGENELAINEGELLYVLEKGEDDWWKAKKKAADDEDEEPVGLVPANYIEEAVPSHTAKALYDYSRQTDEEVSFAEDATLSVFDTSDPDWTLVGVNGDFGFAPFNYIEKAEDVSERLSLPEKDLPPAPVAADRQLEAPPPVRSPASPTEGPAAALASVLGGGTGAPSRSFSGTPANLHRQPTPGSSDEEVAPALPRRPPSQNLAPPPAQYGSSRGDEGGDEEEEIEREPPGVIASPPLPRTPHHERTDEAQLRSPGGFHLYNVSEMVSVMGKRKKMPTTLGLNLASGTIMISPEKTRDGPAQEWTADNMTHYSLEGKHVFLELVRPSKSLDLHAGAKDTAEEITSTLGEIAGAARAEGIREVIAAASGKAGMKEGHMLYDFMAQGDDEVTVAVGDDVVVLDDARSEEWWMVRRLKNGNEGVVPSSYVEVTGIVPGERSSRVGHNTGRSTIEQNRLEEERLAKEAAKKPSSSRLDADFHDNSSHARGSEVGPGVKLPSRGSSLISDDTGRRGKRSSRSEGKRSKPRPDPGKTRTWTDRSGSFKVEAQFIGVSDGKIHLHKANGVKIAVPIAKMAGEDLAYVEKAAGVSLDEDKPLGDLKKPKAGMAGASFENGKPPEYDWFDFFLKAGIGPHQCQRYAQNMNRDSMDESNLPDITPEILRTLGLKEGDILRVMKHLDTMFGRTGKNADQSKGDRAVTSPSGGIFSGAGGALHNNTRKTRPESNRAVSDVVDPKVFEQQQRPDRKSPPQASRPTPSTSTTTQQQTQNGFDDDAWDVKESKRQAVVAQSTTSNKPTSSAPNPPQLTGAMAELSLLSPPLQPTSASPQPFLQPTQPLVQQHLTNQQAQTGLASQQQPSPSGASPSFFGQLNPQQTGLPASQATATLPSQAQLQHGNTQPTSQPGLPRQRPEPPQQTLSPGGLLPPPRPLSAPQNYQQQSQFGPPPLQPQLTGIPNTSASQAPPGQSLNDLSQQQQQQQQQKIPTHITGFPQQGPGFSQMSNGPMQPQSIFQPHGQQFAGPQQQHPYLNGNMGGSPFADPRPPVQPQPTGATTFNTSIRPQGPLQGGVNAVLPPPLQPQQTGFLQQPQTVQPHQTGFQQSQPTGILPDSSPNTFQPQQTGFGQQAQPNGLAGPRNFQAAAAAPPPPPPMPPLPAMQQQPTAAAMPLQPQKTGPPPPVRFGISEANKLTPQPTGRRANLAHATAQNPFGF